MRDKREHGPVKLSPEAEDDALFGEARNYSIIARNAVARVENDIPFRGDFDVMRYVSQHEKTPQEISEPLGRIAAQEAMIPGLNSEELIERIDAFIEFADKKLFPDDSSLMNGDHSGRS